jgi:hypothetical protein
MYASRVASANPTQGSGLMLTAIAAVFLGMTMSEEGEPRVHATLIGVLILGVLDNGLTQMSVDSYVREVLVGAIILAAVASSSLWTRRLRRRTRKATAEYSANALRGWLSPGRRPRLAWPMTLSRRFQERPQCPHRPTTTAW